jgi:tRNA pseudouridine55 synthase
MGHGGTLDPMATGVLIVGIGKGTKHLNSFLGCTKTYETVVLFGKSTDTYDVAGKIVAEAPYEHVTQELVEEKLPQFRGNIKQIPPIYSALKINGMKAYEYARSGKELPRELESRSMKVTECEMLEWYEGGQHEYRWPAEEATEEEISLANRLMKTADSTINLKGDKADVAISSPTDMDPASSETRKRQVQTTPTQQPLSKEAETPTETPDLTVPTKAALHTHILPPSSSTPALAPAARIILSVSSGFYVRSFAHDLGRACGSLAIMASLVRSRQADFTISSRPQPLSQKDDVVTNVGEDVELIQALPYTDLALGEEVWGPKVQAMLERWNRTHSAAENMERIEHRDGPGQWHKNKNRHKDNSHRGSGRKDFASSSFKRDYDGSSELKRRRNSSSPEI